MLTDRQNKFYLRIAKLSDSSSVTEKEKKYLLRTKREIEENVNFQDTINAFNFSLKALEKEKPLTPEVKKLKEDLIAIYGEPDYRMLNKLGEIFGHGGVNGDGVFFQTGSSKESGFSFAYILIFAGVLAWGLWALNII